MCIRICTSKKFKTERLLYEKLFEIRSIPVADQKFLVDVFNMRILTALGKGRINYSELPE